MTGTDSRVVLPFSILPKAQFAHVSKKNESAYTKAGTSAPGFFLCDDAFAS
jgi:hypothetical protein